MRRDPAEPQPATVDGSRAGLVLACGLAGVLTWLLWSAYQDDDRGAASIAASDLANYYYPMLDIVGRRLAVGELPLWNPANCSGAPLLAGLQPAVFYPPTWLSAWLPTPAAQWVLASLHVLGAALATAAALRTGGMHWAAAALGGAFYAQACIFANTLWPPTAATMAWLPWLWLCVEKLAVEWSWRWWCLLAFGTALQLLTGFPQFVVYGFYWLGPYALVRHYEAFRARGRPPRALVRELLWMAAAVALGLGVASVQLLPTFELISQTEREAGLTPEEIHYLDVGTRPAVRVLQNAVQPRAKNPTFDLGSGAGYLGIASLLAVVAGLFRRRGRASSVFLLVAGALALALSDGFNGVAAPLFRLYTELPTGNLFRTPERLRLVYMLCFVILGARGLDTLLRGRLATPVWAWVALAGVSIGVVLAGGTGVGLRAGVSFALASALLFAARSPVARTALAVAWVVFATVDLGLATAPRSPLRAYPVDASERLRSGKVEIDDSLIARSKAAPGQARVEFRRFRPTNGAGPLYGLQRTVCHDPLALGSWRVLQHTLEPGDRKVVAGGVVAPHHANFYDVASVGSLVRNRKGRLVVETNPDALPRAYAVRHARLATREESFAMLRDGSFDFETGVLLDPTSHEGAPAPGVPERRRAARIRVHEPERVEVEVALLTMEPSWLVLTDTFYPGWVAHVDGSPAEIHLANGLYRAVRLPVGAREVVFEYQPLSLRRGLWWSGASILAVLAVGVLGARRERSLSATAASGDARPNSPATARARSAARSR